MIDGILLYKLYSYKNEPVIPVEQRPDGKFACYYPLRSFRYEWVDVDKSELVRMDKANA